MSAKEDSRPAPPLHHGHGHHHHNSTTMGPPHAPIPNASSQSQAGSGQPAKQNAKPHGAGVTLDYKLLVDPFITKGAPTKVYRFAGHVPDQPSYPPIQVRDPRKVNTFDRFWKPEPVTLQIPRFKIDTNYIGEPPPVQVSITNINDNIDKSFLSDLLLKYGAYEEMEIYFHPVTKKHLGLAHVLFLTQRGAAFCIEKLNNTSVMGQVLNVFLDPFKKKCKELLEELTTDKKKAEPPKKDAKKESAVDGKEKHVKEVMAKATDGVAKVKHKGHSSHGHGHGLPKSSSFESYPTPSGYSSTAFAQPVPPPTSTPIIPSSTYFQPALHSNSPTSAVLSPFGKTNGTSEFEGPQGGLADNGNNGISPGQQLDLDTRIKMMLSGGVNLFGACVDEEEGSGSAADVRRSRLSLDKNDIWKASSDGEDDDPIEKVHARKFKRNTFVPVDDEDSRPPSPFLSTEATYSCRRSDGVPNGSGLIRLDGLDEVSDDDSDDDALSPGRRPGKKKPPEPSQEMFPEIAMPPPPSETTSISLPPEYGATPLTPEMQAYYQQYVQTPSSYTPTPDQMPYDPYAAAATGTPTGYPAWEGMDPAAYAAYYQSQYNSAPPLPSEDDPSERDKPDLPELTREEVMHEVEQRLFAELRAIVRRDCQKKLIEQCAFKVLEDWCADKDRRYKDSEANERLQKLQSVGHAGMGLNPDASAQSSDIFGLGFRSTIPRMPSFRRRRTPSTGRGHGSSDEDDQDRDSWRDEGEDSRDSFRERRRDRQRRRSLSSGSGSSSMSMSRSSSSSEEEKSDVEGEDENDKSSMSSGRSSDLDEKLVQKHKELAELSSEEDEAPTLSSEEEPEPEEEDSDAPSAKKQKLREPSPLPPPPRKSKIKSLPSPSPESVPDADADVDIESSDDVDQKEADLVEEPEKKARAFEFASDEITRMDHDYSSKGPPPPEPEPISASRAKKSTKAPKVSLDEFKQPEAVCFGERTEDEMGKVVVDFLMEGIDAEDYHYLKECYESKVNTPAGRQEFPFLSNVRWVEHPVTKVDHKMKVDSWNRVNKTGSCRTEGFYRYTSEEKMVQKQQLITKLGFEMRNKPASSISHSLHLQAGSKNQLIREARSHQRRLLTEFGDNESDLLRFNQLKFRKKDLRFARSYIHDWGLFAAEPIAADEMVIEYVGQVIRASLSDHREKAYEQVGIMSSYLFRLDGDEGLVVDATKCGNLSRFINHSCNPNCIAKTITVEGEKKIVIYSKQEIAVDEEITYDYKFPLEETKIKCLCGAPTCRGYLN